MWVRLYQGEKGGHRCICTICTPSSHACALLCCAPNRERESSLANFSGFEQFMLLKIDEEKEEDEEGEMRRKNPGYTQFVSQTTWAHQMDFEEWKRRCDARYMYGWDTHGRSMYLLPGRGVYALRTPPKQCLLPVSLHFFTTRGHSSTTSSSIGHLQVAAL